MSDNRHRELAELLVRYSIELKPGERCLINAVDVPVECIEEMVDAVYRAGGFPLVNIDYERLHRSVAAGATEESLRLAADCDLYRMKQVDAFIGIRGPANSRETADLPLEQNNLYMRDYYRIVHSQQRIPHTRWVVLRYPSEIMAYAAGMSTRAFEDFYYSVTTGIDYHAMSRAMEPAAAHLAAASEVHITGPGTDLRFSIAGMPSVPCDGKMNIPDGEIYTCPIRESVEGTLSYNVPSTYNGFLFRDVRFSFSKGKIISAASNDTPRINALLDIDEGARYIGEFALGCNPNMKVPMDNTLFDEKIAGSFHFTPGSAYDDCDNGNRSALHWDLVCLQTPEFGGGEIRLDNELIRKDGLFVHPAWSALN